MGRFAPSPTGDLHLGSLLAAVASFLEARANRGRWLLRIEDLDRDREVAGAATRLLRSLESLGLLWDGPIVYQTSRAHLYAEALERLRAANLVFDCCCSRRQLRDEQYYPGTCRQSAPASNTPTAIRFKVDSIRIDFDDLIQGRISQRPAKTTGDFILRRRDGIIAYALAVVVDDAAQGVTHIVRGADLIDSTAGQILLPVSYTHLTLPTIYSV